MGSIVHKTLEEFFKVNPHFINKELYRDELRFILLDIFNTNWKKKFDRINELCSNPYRVSHYYSECVFMVDSWVGNFFKELDSKMEHTGFIDAFKQIVPKTEAEFRSEEFGVRGFIDAIYDSAEEIRIIDYKTSNKREITPEYKLQLAIYALLYQEKHGKMPGKVGINFLKHGIQYIDVDDELLNLAKSEVEVMHINTMEGGIESYQMKPGPLCRWSTGQCDFYGICFEGKNPDELKKNDEENKNNEELKKMANEYSEKKYTNSPNDF